MVEGSNMTAPTTRRGLLKTGAAALAIVPVLSPAVLRAAPRIIKVGFVSTRTGPLAGFGETDDFVVGEIQKALAKGIKAGGAEAMVQIVAKDSQSNPNRAAEVAAELILKDKVDLLLGTNTPDTTNPVADQAEVNEVPCITTNCPWQPYFFGRKGDPAKGFEWTYHFFWGLEDVIGNFTALWNSGATNKVVGGLFPNDADGNAWGDAKLGFPGPLAAQGFKLVDPGRYQPLSSDFTSQIAAFKAANVEILTGVMIPPDFATFWGQAAQQGFKPKIVTIGKALLFPSVIASLGARAEGLTSEIWWSPSHPYKSSLTGQSAAEMCAAYVAATGKPWTQPIGFAHSLFEVAIDVLKRSKAIEPKAILAAIQATDLKTVTGPVKWPGPVKNVAKTPLVAGQWQKNGDKLELVITTNTQAADIPAGGKLKLLG